jgi:hypothetical protein
MFYALTSPTIWELRLLCVVRADGFIGDNQGRLQ